MNENSRGYMRRAIALARQGSAGPFGCVIVRNGEIVGEGNARVFETKDPTAHGEIVAIRAACQRLGTHDLSGCEMYNIAVSCPMCMAALYWARISKLYYCCVPEDAAAYGFDNVSLATELGKPLSQRTLMPAEQLVELRPEALGAYEDYVQRAGRIQKITGGSK
jgi:tRNA(Arg) A34 adenosine deaminase TadA